MENYFKKRMTGILLEVSNCFENIHDICENSVTQWWKEYLPSCE